MISANTLFHFTNKLENIKNILTHNFCPRYCLERLGFLSNEEFDVGIPMICFCDIPLSQISDHVATYGNYAIGLKKEWAITNKISPIIYLHDDSKTNQILIKLVQDALSDDNNKLAKSKKVDLESISNFLDILFYCKTYKGEMWRDGKIIDDVTFYNEREWRYTPNIFEMETNDIPCVLDIKEYENGMKRNKNNKKLSRFQISFTPTDIKYLIISKEEERIEMVEMVEKIKGHHFSKEDLMILKSKVISVDQILQDF